jgi:hypothetical protein
MAVSESILVVIETELGTTRDFWEEKSLPKVESQKKVGIQVG